jgi:hypothetical protein
MPKIELDGKVNILALTSLVLSLLALASQISNYMRGAQVELHDPQTVILRLQTFPADKAKSYIHFEAPMTFTNLGANGFNGIVSNETVEFTFENVKRSFRAYWTFKDVDDEKTNRDVAPTYIGTELAGPKVVPGQGAITHWARFVPKAQNCATFTADQCDAAANSVLLDERSQAVLSKTDEIELVFRASLVGATKGPTASCSINGASIDFGQLHSRGWSVVDCFSQKHR